MTQPVSSDSEHSSSVEPRDKLSRHLPLETRVGSGELIKQGPRVELTALRAFYAAIEAFDPNELETSAASRTTASGYYREMACLYAQMEELDLAMEAWRHAADLSDHPQRSIQMWIDCAGFYQQNKNWVYALQGHEQVIRRCILNKEYSLNRASVLQSSVHAVQYIYQELYPGRTSSAAETLLQALPQIKQEHAADLLQSLAGVYFQQNHVESAVDTLYFVATELRRDGDLCWEAVDAMEQMASIQEDSKNFDNALICYEKALLAKSTYWGEDHLEVAKSLFDVARTMDLAGNTAGSTDLYHAAKSMYAKNATAQLAAKTHEIGNIPILFEHGRHEEAITVLTDYLETVEQGGQDKSRIYFDLGRAYIALGNYVSATICLVEAVKEDGEVTEQEVVALLQHVDYLQRHARRKRRDDNDGYDSQTSRRRSARRRNKNTALSSNDEKGSSTPVTWEEESVCDSRYDSLQDESSSDEATAFYDSEPEAGLDAELRSHVSSSSDRWNAVELPCITIEPIPDDIPDNGKHVKLFPRTSPTAAGKVHPRVVSPALSPNLPVRPRPNEANSMTHFHHKKRPEKIKRRKVFGEKFRRKRKDGFESLPDEDKGGEELVIDHDYHSLATFDGPIQFIELRSKSFESAVSQITLRMDEMNSSRESASQEWWWSVTSEGVARWFPSAYLTQAVEAAEGFLSAKAIHAKKPVGTGGFGIISGPGRDGNSLSQDEIAGPVDLNSIRKGDATSGDKLSDEILSMSAAQPGSVMSGSRQHRSENASPTLLTEISLCKDRLAKQQDEHGRTHPDVALTLFTLAVLNSRNYCVASAVECASEALRIQKLNGSADDAIRSLHFLADIHLHQKQFKSALSYYAEALRLESNRSGYYSDETAQTLNCIGAARALQNEFALAMESHQEALRILKYCHGEDPKHPLVCDTLCQIGSVYYRERNSLSAIKNKKDGYTTFIEGGMLELIGRAHEDRGSYKMAISFFEEKLQFLEHNGERHNNIEEAVTTMNSLGMLSVRAGLFSDAIDYYDRALSLQLQLGCSEVEVATARVLAGSVHFLYGQWPEALKLLQDALEILRRELGNTHETVAATQYQLATVYIALFEERLGLEMMKQAFSTQMELLGAQHAATLRTRREMGVVLSVLRNDFESSIAVYNEVLEVQHEIHGNKHPNIADTLYYLGQAYARKRDYTSAVKHLEKSYYMRLEFLGWDHPMQASTLFEIAKIHVARGRLEKASSICDVVLRIRSEALAATHIDVAKTLALKGCCLSSRGLLDDASMCLNASVTMGEKAVGADHPTIAEFRVERGLLYLRKCQFDDARKEIVNALDIFERASFDDKHPSIVNAMEQLKRIERDELLCV